jgi:hypothetical protein
MISKKLLVLTGVALFSISVGLLPNRVQAQSLFESTSYYFILTLFFLWLACIVRFYRVGFKERLLRHYVALLLSVVLTMLIFISSPPRFKVLADETNLLGMSMMMHQNRTTTLPMEGISKDYDDSNYLTIPDKRPILFPFLVSVVHSLSGYAPTNGFILNFVVSCGILFLFYVTTVRLLPMPYGWLALLLAAGMPIYMINVTSSGFEALNLFYLLFYFLFLLEVFKYRNEVKRIELLLLSTLLLAQCRYESAIFVITAGICLLPMISKKLFSQMSWLTCIMPLFLVPVLWQRKLFFGRNEFNKIGHETFEVAENLFSLKNLWSNFDDNIFVLLGMNPHYGYTPFLSITAIIGIYLLIRTYIRKEPVEIAPKIFFSAMLSTVLLFLIISSYFWGNFGLKMDNRLSLVFLPFLLWPAVYALYILQKRHLNRFSTVITVIAVIHLIFYWSYGSQQRLVNRLSLQYEYNRVMKFLEPRYPKSGSTLIIAEQPNLYLIQNYSSMRFSRIQKIMEFLSTPNNVDHIIALQKIEKKSGRIAEKSILKGPFEMKTLDVFSISTDLEMRISLCKIIDGGRRIAPNGKKDQTFKTLPKR